MQGVTKALIVGGGIAGMATALDLRKRGVMVDLIEADPSWRVYGAGISITGATFRAFKGLGLLDDLLRVGGFGSGHRAYHFSGQLIEDVDAQPLEDGLPSVGGVMRPLLHEIMARKVKESGTDVRLGVTAVAVTNEPGRAEARFSDGTSGSYDLVVGADGIHSSLRKQVFPDAPAPVFTGQSSWRVVVDRPADMDKTYLYLGHENLFGMMMVSDAKAYVFVLNPDPEKTRLRDDELYDKLVSLLADFGGHAKVVRENLSREDTIVYRPLEAVLVPRPWHSGRIVLIGDAAHATTPHLASGAGSAVEDALVLGEELDNCGGEVSSALEAFEQRRFDRCKIVVETSVAIGEQQLQHGPPSEIGRLMQVAYAALAQPI